MAPEVEILAPKENVPPQAETLAVEEEVAPKTKSSAPEEDVALGAVIGASTLVLEHLPLLLPCMSHRH